jgi:ComF family protein
MGPEMIIDVALGILGELIAPTRCAACDERVAPRVLFCAGCGIAVMRAASQPDGQHAVFAYGGAIATAIVRLKYAGRFDLASRFGAVMADVMEPLAAQVDVVVPVPLHPARLAERGFDQAALLAGPVARGLRTRSASRAIVRTRATPRQASLDRSARSANVATAFQCRSPRLVEGRRVLLVDDVRTTGATLASCAEVLRAAGASRVLTLVLASRDFDEIDGEYAKYDG